MYKINTLCIIMKNIIWYFLKHLNDDISHLDPFVSFQKLFLHIYKQFLSTDCIIMYFPYEKLIIQSFFLYTIAQKIY